MSKSFYFKFVLDQILDADDPNGSPNATYEQDFIILNGHIDI